MWPSKGEGTQKRQKHQDFPKIMMLAPPKGNAALNEKEKGTAAPASKLLLPMNNKRNEDKLILSETHIYAWGTAALASQSLHMLVSKDKLDMLSNPIMAWAK